MINSVILKNTIFIDELNFIKSINEYDILEPKIKSTLTRLVYNFVADKKIK